MRLGCSIHITFVVLPSISKIGLPLICLGYNRVMSTPILVTKLFVPTTRPEIISRPRLTEQLNGGLNRKLTLISAPAGFGKTTLASSWIQTMEEDTSSSIAWLSLDEGDNDPAQFLNYFIAALDQFTILLLIKSLQNIRLAVKFYTERMKY